MRIQDIEMQPSNESVVAHLQDRLREAWIQSDSHPNQESLDLLDAISLCLKANGYPELSWNEDADAWVPWIELD